MKVGTHNGVFHADEVYACAALYLIKPEDGLEIIRTRDVTALSSCDMVIDVGGQYDPDARKYDHHQATFDERRPDGTPYSSFGLVWRHEVIPQLSGQRLEAGAKVDESFVRFVDCTDAGEPLHTGQAYTINSVISTFNPTWNRNENEDTAFHHAVSFALEHLRQVFESALAVIDARDMVTVLTEDAVNASSDALILNTFAPWGDALQSADPHSKLVKIIFPNAQGTWMVQGRAVAPGSFKTFVSHREDLRGLPAAELQAASGIPDAVFVHKNGFIGGCKTLDGAKQLAALMVANPQD